MTGNEVEIRVTAKNNTKPGLESSRQDTKRFSEDFDRLITKSLQGGETAFESTTRRAAELRVELERMRADFAKTGDKGLLGNITKSTEDLNFLEAAVRTMTPRIEQEFAKMGGKAGKTGGKHAGDEFIKSIPYGIGSGAMAIGSAVTSLFERIGKKAGTGLSDGVASTAAEDVPQLFTPEGAIGAGILAGIAVTLAPAIGGAIALAMTAGVGGGFLAIGALVERNNANLVAKAHQLGSDISDTMSHAASGLDEPFARALARIDTWVAGNGPKLKAIFDSLAPSVEPLTQMVLGFISNVTPGLQHLAQTFTDVFSDPQTKDAVDSLGKNVDAFFETIGRHKQLIVDTFTTLISFANAALGILNAIINAGAGVDYVWRKMTTPLQDIYQHFHRIDDASKWIPATQQDTESLIPTVQTAALSYDDLAASLAKTATTADTLAGALTDKVLGQMMAGDLATLHWNESLTTLSKTLHDNSNALDIHTAKGQADREAVLASVQANIAQYDSMISAGLSAKDAATSYDVNTKALEKQMRQAGLTQTQIDGLIGKYRGVPTKVNTTIALLGLTKAIEDLDTTLKLINGIPLTKTFTLHVRQVGGLGPSVPSAGEPNWTPPSTPQRQGASGGLGHHASGGIAGGLTWLGERGAELVRLPQGSTVYPAGQSAGMAGQLAAPSGSRGPAQMVFGGNTNTALAALVMEMFRTGQIQLIAGGQRVKVAS